MGTYCNLNISVRLVAYELLGTLFDNLGFYEGPQGCHGDWWRKQSPNYYYYIIYTPLA